MLEQSEYHVMESNLQVKVCATFSEDDAIERAVTATFETFPTDSTDSASPAKGK